VEALNADGGAQYADDRRSQIRFMSLTPEQRSDLARLLAQELEEAWRTAADDGAGPDDLADMVDERRQAVRFSATRTSAGPIGEKTIRRRLGNGR
jgi:hypothetical protein